MADHNKPVLTSTYANFVSELDARFDDLAVGLDPAVTSATNLPVNTLRWNSVLAKDQKWNGSSWVDKSNFYNLSTVRINTSSSVPGYGSSLTVSHVGGDTEYGVAIKSATAGDTRHISFHNSDGVNTGSIRSVNGGTSLRFEGDSAGLYNNADYLVQRASVADSAVDTVSDNSFRNVAYSGQTRLLVSMTTGGSTGTVQTEYGYAGDLKWRNKTDGTTWQPWRKIFTSTDITDFWSPILLRTNAAQVRSDLGARAADTETSGTTTGSSTAYVFTPSSPIAAYVASLSFWVRFHIACSSNPTLQISSIPSSLNLVKQLPDGTYVNLTAGDFVDNHRSRITLLSTTQALVEELPPTHYVSGSNLGMGVAPNAWSVSAGTSALQIGTRGASLLGTGASWSASPYMYLSNNAYHSAGAWKYQSNEASAQYIQNGSTHTWLSAAAGSSGSNIVFEQIMSIDSSGNLNLNSNGRLIVQPSASSNAALQQYVNNAGVLYVGLDSAGGGLGGAYSANIWHSGAYPLVFGNSNVERARIAPNGQMSTTDGAGNVLPAYDCRAWVNFSGTGTISIRAAGNVSSITDNGVGDYIVNFTVPISDTSYAVNVTMQKDSETGNETGPSISTRTTSSVRVLNKGYDSVLRDSSVVCVSVFR